MHGALTTLAAGLVPEGPLHPTLLVTGLVAGLAGSAVAGRDGTRWLLITVAGAVLLAQFGQDDVLRAAFGARDDRAVVVATTIAVAVAGLVLRPRWSTAVVAAIGATAGVWAVVPDTEVPLICGAVLAGASLVRCLPGWLPDERRRGNGVVFVLPALSAAAGTIGRTGRHVPALALGVLGAVLALSTFRLARAVWRSRQRAGTPTTVAPGATSSITTAPAPTTAS